MPTIDLSNEQVLSLIKQLPPAGQRAALLALAGSGTQRRAERMEYAEDQLRRICSERGLSWEKMSEEERQNFVEDLVHEDRGCGK